MDDFEIRNGILIRYHGDDNHVTVPEGVFSIGEEAFACCENLISVILPEGVTSIGNDAFAGCRALNSIRIPESVTSIGEHAFFDCRALNNIHIPESVTSIGEHAFRQCFSLTSITIPNGITSIKTGTFTGCISLNSIHLPESITAIEDSGFSSCKSMTSFTIPKNVTTIGEYAFSFSGLTSMIIPENVTSIGENAFHDCTDLTCITLPEKITSIGKYAFGLCHQLTLHYRHYQFPPSSSNGLCTTVLNMIENKDFSVKLSSYWKFLLTIDMYLSAPDEQETIAYLQENFAEIFSFLFERQQIELLRQMILSGKFITKKNIDTLIQYAIEQKAYEIQIMLTDYKAQKIGYDDIAATIKKKFAL